MAYHTFADCRIRGLRQFLRDLRALRRWTRPRCGGVVAVTRTTRYLSLPQLPPAAQHYRHAESMRLMLLRRNNAMRQYAQYSDVNAHSDHAEIFGDATPLSQPRSPQSPLSLSCSTSRRNRTRKVRSRQPLFVEEDIALTCLHAPAGPACRQTLALPPTAFDLLCLAYSPTSRCKQMMGFPNLEAGSRAPAARHIGPTQRSSFHATQDCAIQDVRAADAARMHTDRDLRPLLVEPPRSSSLTPPKTSREELQTTSCTPLRLMIVLGGYDGRDFSRDTGCFYIFKTGRGVKREAGKRVPVVIASTASRLLVLECLDEVQTLLSILVDPPHPSIVPRHLTPSPRRLPSLRCHIPDHQCFPSHINAGDRASRFKTSCMSGHLYTMTHASCTRMSVFGTVARVPGARRRWGPGTKIGDLEKLEPVGGVGVHVIVVEGPGIFEEPRAHAVHRHGAVSSRARPPPLLPLLEVPTTPLSPRRPRDTMSRSPPPLSLSYVSAEDAIVKNLHELTPPGPSVWGRPRSLEWVCVDADSEMTAVWAWSGAAGARRRYPQAQDEGSCPLAALGGVDVPALAMDNHTLEPEIYVSLGREREELREPASYFFAVDWEPLVCWASIAKGRLGTTTPHFYMYSLFAELTSVQCIKSKEDCQRGFLCSLRDPIDLTVVPMPRLHGIQKKKSQSKAALNWWQAAAPPPRNVDLPGVELPLQNTSGPRTPSSPGSRTHLRLAPADTRNGTKLDGLLSSKKIRERRKGVVLHIGTRTRGKLSGSGPQPYENLVQFLGAGVAMKIVKKESDVREMPGHRKPESFRPFRAAFRPMCGFKTFPA
ncbi:hypothetical protein B0H13DRAFT_2275379 [Mycena leptocephala]|nr:hypothetical protein B0H13DRAFT_2275379 [Mycena leptocephala]